jgi:hypothetical protein
MISFDSAAFGSGSGKWLTDCFSKRRLPLKILLLNTINSSSIKKTLSINYLEGFFAPIGLLFIDSEPVD